MIDPRFDDSTPLECAGCAEPTEVTTVIDGQMTPICHDCLHDSTFICAGCVSRFWQVDGHRLYISPALYCGQCFRGVDDAAHQTWTARQDEHRDDFNQHRR